MRKYIAEFIGTFFLVTVIGLTGNPIAIGSILMVMVYMGGHISGAHYNPAVTVAMMIRNRISFTDGISYILFQILGAFAAAAFVWSFHHVAFSPRPVTNINILKPLAIEMLFTFALASVVLNVATHSKTMGNSFYGLAIGFAVLAAAFAGGPISGGAFNPAVGIGPIMMDSLVGGDSLKFLWLYLVGPLTGGVVAAFVFKFLHPEEK